MLKIKARQHFLLLFLVILFLACVVDGKKYTKCELSSEIQNVLNVTADEVKNYICIAQKFSRLNTNIVVGEFYGIFQINNKWCGDGVEGGDCNIKCEKLLDDDITDDIKCAQKIISKIGMNGWRKSKIQGCIKNYQDNCPNKEKNVNHLQRDYCEYATKLIATYDISKLDAMTWSCIQYHSNTHASTASKTGKVNLKLAKDDDQVAACVDNRDVECSIKINKQRSNNSVSGFSAWTEYKEFCENISNDEITKCFSAHDKSENEEIKLTDFESSQKENFSKRFTTSTEISVIIEEDQANVVTIKNEPETSTEFLSKTIEKPANENDDIMSEAYSKVRLMFSDKNNTENSALEDDLPVNNSLRCDITRSFDKSGLIPIELIPTFVCIAEHESRLNVTLIKQNGNVQKFGLFQIDDLNFCNTNDKINECDVLCLHLVDNQFDNDLECANYIYKKVGFVYWPSYFRHCRDVNSNLVESCQEIHTTTHRPFTVPNYELLKQKFNLTERLETTTITIAEKHDAIKNEELQTTSTPISSAILKQYDICEFSQQLYSNENILLNDLTNYVCIADQASKLQIFKTIQNDEIGIFGIKSDSCEKCSIECTELLNEDLHDDVECVTKIYKEKSLNYWNLTEEACKLYSNKILQCIDEDKFITVDEEKEDNNEFNFSKMNSQKAQLKERTEAFETTEKNQLEESAETTEKFNIENSSTEKVNNEVEIQNDKVRLLLHKTLDDLLKELAQNLTNEEMSSIKVPLEKLNQAETEKNYTEEDISKMEQKIHNALNGILKMLEENEPTTKEALNDDTKKTLTTETVHVDDSESQLSHKVFVKQSIDGKIITEKDSRESTEDLDDDHLMNSMSEEESLITTEIPKDATISLLNLKILPKKKLHKTKMFDDDEIITTTTEIDDIYTTLEQDQLPLSTINPNQEVFENENYRKFTTTNDPLYYTSVKEIFDDYEKFEERNIVKRKTTQYPESDEDFTTTEDSAEFEAATSENFISTTTKSLTTTNTEDPEKVTFPPLSHGVVDKCALIRNIREADIIPQNLISTFICIAEHESGLNVSLVRSDGGKNRKMRYGIFQIDEMEYCNTNEIINKCDVLCSHLNDDQFDNDLECVMEIYNTEGLKYWPSYSRHCSHVDPNAYDDDCRIVFITTHRPFTPFDREAALHDLFTTTTATTTTTTIQTTTLPIPKFNYTDDDERFIIRRYDLCEITNEVYKSNVTLEEIPRFICAADLISKLKIRKPLLEDEKYGLFQIDKEYCEEGGLCGIKCSDLLDEDLTEDIRCLKKIEENKVNLWNLNTDACKSYQTSFLNCIDNDLFHTTKDPSSNEITPWIGFISTTESINSQEKEQNSEEETTTSYYENGVLTTIEVLKSTQIPSTEQKQAISPLHEVLLPPHFDEKSTTEEDVHTTSTEKSVTLSIFLQPPHFEESEENIETSTISDVDETTIAVNNEQISSNITEEDLKRIFDEIILSPNNILPNINISDENEENFKKDETTIEPIIEKYNETTIKSVIEDEAKSSEITTDKSQDEISTTLPSLETSITQKTLDDSKRILHQFLLPPKDDKNSASEEIETESPAEFRIVVTSEEITTPSIENLITLTTNTPEQPEISRSTQNEVDITTATTIPPSSYSSPIFKRRSTTKSIQMNDETLKTRNLVTNQLNNNNRRRTTILNRSTTTEKYETSEKVSNDEQSSIKTTTENPQIIVEDLKSDAQNPTTTISTIIEEKEIAVEKLKIIKTLMTTSDDEKSKTLPLNLPQIILNNKNLKDQVETIIKAHSEHESTKNISAPLVFNIFNFNIDGQNHDVKYSIHGNDQKKPNSS